jgi:hypothetical protein
MQFMWAGKDKSKTTAAVGGKKSDVFAERHPCNSINTLARDSHACVWVWLCN